MVQNESSLTIDAATWRLRLSARLALERANLLRQLRALDEKTVSTFLVEGEWTAKDILAHVGWWDAFHTERMNLVLNGRINAIYKLGGREEMDARNAEFLLFSHNLTLEQSLAIGLKERGSFLATLARIPDDLLHQEIELPWGWRTRMREWAEIRYQHDATHVKQLKTWRDGLTEARKLQIGPPFLLRAILKATRKEILTLADLILPHERTSTPVCGIWSLKDLVGHLTDWEQVGIAGLRQLADGQTPEFDEVITDFDIWNNAHADARRDQPWEAVWAEFQETRTNLLALVDQINEGDWQRPFTTPWGSQSNGYFWATIWTGHEHEHAADIRQKLGEW